MALILLGAVVLLLPSFVNGPPIGHDYPVHVVYMDAFTSQLAAGEPYPRWLSGLWGGAGAPDLFFYGPLVYWLGGALRLTVCPGCGADQLLLATGLFWQVLYGAGLWSLALRWFGRWPALGVAIVGMALPFHMGTEWGDRFAFGEFAVAALIPWHLSAVLDCLAGRRAGLRLAILSALVLLGHVVTGLMLATLYPVLLLALGRATDWRAISRLALAGVTGLGLSALFWYPAVTLLDSVNAEFIAEGFFDASAWLFWPRELVLTDPTIIGIWPPLLGLSLMSMILLALYRDGPAEARRLIATLIFLPLVLLTPLAWPLFELTPLRSIQFPWRFLVIADVGVALAFGYAMNTVRLTSQQLLRNGLLATCMAAFVLISVNEHPGLRDSRNIYRKSADKLTGVSAGYLSWLPAEADLSVAHDIGAAGLPAFRAIADAPPVRVLPELPGARVAVVSSSARRLELEVDLPAPTSIVVRRTFWRHATLHELPEGSAIPLRPTGGFPLTMADLPAGSGRYVMELPVLQEERTGLLISLASLLFAAGWFLRQHGHRARASSGMD